MASVPPVLDELIASLEDQLTKTEDKLREARAQIAAKDAALLYVRDHLVHASAHPSSLIIKRINDALAETARGTE